MQGRQLGHLGCQMDQLGRQMDQLGSQMPGPLKCFSAPGHQILGKSAPQKAHNRDKAEFVTKVRKSS